MIRKINHRIAMTVCLLVACCALPGQWLGVMAQTITDAKDESGSLDDMLSKFIDETEDADVTKEDTLSASSVDCDNRLDDIERRLEELERTSIDATEAEAIAVRVVQRYAQLLRVAIDKPTGGQRVETVQFSSPTDTRQFQLSAGERISSYTDVQTGQTVRVGEPTTQYVSSAFAAPVPTWRTSHIVMQSTPAPVTTVRTFAVRPVVQTFQSPTTQSTTTYRRGLFGRQNMRTSTGAGSTCRVVNGQVVCN